MASGKAPDTAELQQEGFSYFQEDTAQSGTKRYLIARGKEVGLPELGDPFDTQPSKKGCLLRSREVSLYGPYADVWDMKYSTPKNSSEAATDANLSSAELLRNLDAGANMQNIGEAFQRFNATGDFLEGDSFTHHFTANVKINKVYRSFDGLMSKCRSFSGCINSVPMFGQPAGTVQLGPVTANEFVNKYGQKRWMASFTFMIRCVPDQQTLNPPVTWEYSMNPNFGKWDKLVPSYWTYKDISQVLA